jgi:hypothetical protein
MTTTPGESKWRALLIGKMTRGRLILDACLLFCLASMAAYANDVIGMPEQSFSGKQPPLSAHEGDIRNHLESNVRMLAATIGPRNSPQSLRATTEWAESQFMSYGLEVSEQPYKVDGVTFKNVEGTLSGSTNRKDILIVCAHYDTVFGAPGANDNGSGCASVVELARLLAYTKPKCTIRFVLFGTEEPPYFSTKEMGSYFYAARCKERGEKILGVIVMETLGYYTDEPKSQHYPALLAPAMPDTGNFIGFIANQPSKQFVSQCLGTFRRTTQFPSQGVAAPEWLNGVDWADQYWFWKLGYPGIMITDTALYRYPYYHTPQDTPDKLSYGPFARVVGGMEQVIGKISSE